MGGLHQYWRILMAWVLGDGGDLGVVGDVNAGSCIYCYSVISPKHPSFSGCFLTGRHLINFAGFFCITELLLLLTIGNTLFSWQNLGRWRR